MPLHPFSNVRQAFVWSWVSNRCSTSTLSVFGESCSFKTDRNSNPSASCHPCFKLRGYSQAVTFLFHSSKFILQEKEAVEMDIRTQMPYVTLTQKKTHGYPLNNTVQDPAREQYCLVCVIVNTYVEYHRNTHVSVNLPRNRMWYQFALSKSIEIWKEWFTIK